MADFLLATEVDIHASPAKVWSVLADFARYPEWNPFVRAVEGRPEPGTRLHVTGQPPGGKPMRFRPRVLAAVPGAELRWLGRVGLPGIFDGEHRFVLEATAPACTRLHHSEHFSGLLVGAMRRQLDTGTRAGFEAMNAALKARSEA
ncbi:SRPBCC family protein [Arenimonas sp.]|uniref:SRPBCC family protein n=1 Tax=Arenimonas sp. TaxID=1872635 RepID=UPI0035AF66A7